MTLSRPCTPKPGIFRRARLAPFHGCCASHNIRAYSALSCELMRKALPESCGAVCVCRRTASGLRYWILLAAFPVRHAVHYLSLKTAHFLAPVIFPSKPRTFLLPSPNFCVCDSALRILSYFALISQDASEGAGSFPRRMMTEGRMG